MHQDVELSKPYGVIYCLTSPSGKKYIGQSKDIRKRFNAYKNLLCKNQRRIYNALLKYGFQNFKASILCECSSLDDLNKSETYFIKKHDTVNNGYNLNYGGEVEEFIQETKDLIKRAYTPERKRLLSLRVSGEKNPMYGKGRSGADNPMYGKKWTEEQKRIKSEKTRGVLAPNYGKKWSEEHKNKIRLTLLSKSIPKQLPEKKPKIFYTFIHDSGEIYTGTRANFKNKYNLDSGDVSRFTNRENYSIKGWRFIDSPQKRLKSYTFIHDDSSSFTGSIVDFVKKYNLSYNSIYSLINNRKTPNTINGWKVVGKEIE